VDEILNLFGDVEMNCVMEQQLGYTNKKHISMLCVFEYFVLPDHLIRMYE